MTFILGEDKITLKLCISIQLISKVKEKFIKNHTEIQLISETKEKEVSKSHIQFSKLTNQQTFLTTLRKPCKLHKLGLQHCLQGMLLKCGTNNEFNWMCRCKYQWKYQWKILPCLTIHSLHLSSLVSTWMVWGSCVIWRVVLKVKTIKRFEIVLQFISWRSLTSFCKESPDNNIFSKSRQQII